MVWIKPGTFLMGSPRTETDRYDNEGPQNRVSINYTFAVGKYPVTRGEWRMYANETGHQTTKDCDWRNPGFAQDDRHPVVCVNWKEAQDYIAWLNTKSGQHFRLLTEAEWEYAARAGTTTAYYWGAKAGREQANCDGCGSQWDNKQTSPVGSFPPNPWGLYDMAGNVWQWVQDCWHENYDAAPTDGRAWESGDCTKRIMRGASWFSFQQNLRTADRGPAPSGDNRSGFRVARPQ
jgi:formylglycine-generating enzyme required for sulfatase activity